MCPFVLRVPNSSKLVGMNGTALLTADCYDLKHIHLLDCFLQIMTDTPGSNNIRTNMFF
jgi:hypothetical protein